MKLTDFMITEQADSVESLTQELKLLQKELIAAKSGGSDAVVRDSMRDIKLTKEKLADAIADAEAMA